jgi:hypothetical protein
MIGSWWWGVAASKSEVQGWNAIGYEQSVWISPDPVH